MKDAFVTKVCSNADILATINLVKEYLENRYRYSKKDIPHLISTDIKLQLTGPSPKLDKDIEIQKQTNLDKEQKKTKPFHSK